MVGHTEHISIALAYTYKLAGKYMKAIEVFKDCQTQLDATGSSYMLNPTWHPILLEVYELMDKYDEGVQMFESLLSTFSYAAPSWVWSGLLLAMS